MRNSMPAASLARLVALALAAPVIAHAIPTHSFGSSSSSSTASSSTSSNGTMMTAPVITAAPPASPSTSSGSSSGTAGTTPTPTNTTQTDQRAVATNQAVQRERASGNTSASQIIVATTPQPAATVSPTSGTTTSGGSSVGTGTSVTATGGTATGTGGTTTGTVVGTSLGFPGSVGIVMNSGEPAVDVNGNLVVGNAAYAVAPTVTQATAYAPPQYAAAEVAFADNTMNQVIGEARRDRHRVGRNGQLLYSIAPRTNVDRSREVPDDGPSPALTGPLSR